MIGTRICKCMEVGEKGRDSKGWYIVLNSLNSELVRSRVGDEIFYTENKKLILSKIESVKKRLSAGGKISLKPKNCIVNLTYQDRTSKAQKQ